MSISNTFYVLQPPYLDEQYQIYGQSSWESEFGRASWADGVSSETIRCPRYPGHQRAGARIGDLAIILPSSHVGDFVWTWYSECLITNDLFQDLSDARFTGFSVGPVLIENHTQTGEALGSFPTVWELIVTGMGGDADRKSGIRRIFECPHCGMVEYSSFHHGIVVNEDVWDGSDFFTINGYPRFILVTERVKTFLIQLGVTNCALVPSQALKWGATVRPEDMHRGHNES